MYKKFFIYKKYSNHIFILLIVSMLVVVDLTSKQYIVENFQGPVNIAPFLTINLVYNYGISFGMLAFVKPIVWVIVAFIILFFVAMHLPKNISILICSGGLGNIYDRYTYGYVIDFIDLHPLGYHFFIFNIADIYISLGAMLLMLRLSKGSINTKI